MPFAVDGLLPVAGFFICSHSAVPLSQWCPHDVYATIVSFYPESTLLIVNFIVVQSPGMRAGRAKEGSVLFALVSGN